MSQSKEAIERGISLYEDLIAENAPLTREYESSRRDFQVSLAEDTENSELADRRHLEWFLLERPATCLAEVPVRALRDQWQSRADALHTEVTGADVLQQSFSGVFEVTASEPGQGLWLRDLFGVGEYPVEEQEASAEVHAGDLFVGRIFPVGDGVHCASPAVQLFRDAGLLEAVRRDLDRLRASRRGVLRIEQVEIERLFFHGDKSVPGATRSEDLLAERRRVRKELVHAGLDKDLVDLVLSEVARGAREGEGDLISILNALAFADDVDLRVAQRLLSDLWGMEGSCAVESPQDTGAVNGSMQSVTPAECVDAQAALEAFDLRRAKGGDLGLVFEELASDLGLEGVDDEGEEITLPDFPGVVGAMVEEFLWDVAREEGQAAADKLASLRKLSTFGIEIGVFESLGAREILDFAGRWIFDVGELRDEAQARELMLALERFCSWCEKNHSHPLATECAGFFEGLHTSVPRVACARRECSSTKGAMREPRPYELLRIEETEVLVRDDSGTEQLATVAGKVGEFLVAGDLLHGRLEGALLEISSCYPGELRELLKFRS